MLLSETGDSDLGEQAGLVVRHPDRFLDGSKTEVEVQRQFGCPYNESADWTGTRQEPGEFLGNSG